MTNYEVRQLGEEYLRISISKARIYSNFTKAYNKDWMNESISPKWTGIRDIERENNRDHFGAWGGNNTPYVDSIGNPCHMR